MGKKGEDPGPKAGRGCGRWGVRVGSTESHHSWQDLGACSYGAVLLLQGSWGNWLLLWLKETVNRTSFLWQILVSIELEIGWWLNQWFSNFSMRKNDLKGVLKPRLLIFHPEFLIIWSKMEPESLLFIPAWGPHFENCYFRQPGSHSGFPPIRKAVAVSLGYLCPENFGIHLYFLWKICLHFRFHQD